MTRSSTSLAALAIFMACGGAAAIPPPWTLEEAKAKADLVLIARTTTARKLKSGTGVNMEIGLRPIRVLKGRAPKTAEEAPTLRLAFHQPPKAHGNIRPRVVGGTGHPKPADGETALVFLRRRGKNEPLRVVCGKFGYVSLSTGTKEARDRVEQRLARYRKWCERIGDAKLRQAMEGYYDAVLEHVRKTAEKADTAD
jgi:hypothetical protein